MTKSNIKFISMKFVRNRFFTTGLLLMIYILTVLYFPMLYRMAINVLVEHSLLLQSKESITAYFILFYSIGTLATFTGILKINGVKYGDFWRPCRYSFADFVADLALCLLLIFASTFFTAIPLHALGIEDSALMPIGVPSSFADLTSPAFLTLFLLVSPLIEEVAYRGIFLRFLGRYGNRFALVAVSLFYALAHSSIAEFVPAFVLSYFLGRITLYYRSVYPAVTIHLLYNLFFCLLGLITKETYPIFVASIFVLFIGLFFFIYHRGFRNIQFRKSANTKILFKLFCFTPSMTISLLLLLVHTILSYFYR